MQGIRIWELNGNYRQPRLVSLVYQTPTEREWGPIVKADCVLGDKHQAPHRNCLCGIYALKSRGSERKDLETMKSLFSCYSISPWSFVGGYVNLWGHIVEHESGYRAEYAQVERLYVNQETPKHVLQELSRYYHCDVSYFLLPLPNKTFQAGRVSIFAQEAEKKGGEG